MAEETRSASPFRSLLIEQAAQLMGVSRRTVYYRIREGRLETIRTRGGSRRIVVTSLEALLREGERRRRPRLAASLDRVRGQNAGV